VLTIIIIVLLAIPLSVAWFYNRFISQRQVVKEAWSGMDIQLKRRYDLVPALVEVVKGYAAHEENTLESVTRQRSTVENLPPIQPTGPSQTALSVRAKTEASLATGIKSIFALAENYPDLKANQNFLQLQAQLVDIEDNLQFARRYFNGTIRDWNTLVFSFPANLLAEFFRFEPKEFFSLSYASERENPDVDI